MSRRKRWLLLVLGLLAGALLLGGYPAGRYLWADYHRRAARAAAERRAFDQALAHWAECLKVWPDDLAACLEAARAARRAGALPEAERYLRQCRRLQAGSPAVALEGDLLDAQAGRWTARQEGYLWSLVDAGHPETPLILEAMTQGYLYSYRLDGATDCLQRWLRDEPDNSQALFWRGWVGEGRQNLEAAEADYRRVVELSPDRTDARQRLAEVLLVTGRAGEALEHFERLHAKQPADVGVLLGLARCRRATGQTGEARRLLDELLAAHPREPAALREQGAALLAEGRPDEAEDWLRRSQGADPYDPETCYTLGQCLVQLGRKDEADWQLAQGRRIDADLEQLRALNDKISRSPADPALRCEAGAICLRNGQSEEALRWFNGALQLDPACRAAHQALAEHYERTGQPEQAARHRTFLTP